MQIRRSTAQMQICHANYVEPKPISRNTKNETALEAWNCVRRVGYRAWDPPDASRHVLAIGTVRVNDSEHEYKLDSCFRNHGMIKSPQYIAENLETIAS